MDPRCYRVIQGEVAVSIEITKHPFDLICFTGSTEKGRLVAKAAADNLIPCILELGGKCPFIVDEGCDVDHAAFKAIQAKFQNASQTCITVDYILCHESLVNEFTERVKYHLKNMYGVDNNRPETWKYNPEVGKIIADFHIDRIERILKEVESNPKTKIITGGSSKIDRANKFVCPTILRDPPLESTMMKEENFAPILPILSYVNFSEVINKHILTKGKPLCIYYFGSGSSQNYKDILENTSSGNVTLNDILFQTLSIEVGFGGVGESGCGRYGGYEGFRNWSNPKSVVEKVQFNFWPFTYMAPPWDNTKQ